MQHVLRIIQVVNVRWYNATAWYALSLSRLLAAAGHEVVVLALPGAEPLQKTLDHSYNYIDLSLNSVNPFIVVREYNRVRKLLHRFRPHIVNCHRGEGMFFWAMLKTARSGFALVRTRGDQRPPKANAINRYLYSHLADAVIATNSRTAAQCRDLLGVPAPALRMIPGGVDRAAFAPDPAGRAELRRRFGWADEDIVVGMLGRFDPVKGHRQLMEAFSAVRQRAGASGSGRPRLLLMGYSARYSRDDLNAWLRELNLEDCALVAGRVDDVAAHISAMDVGVVASQGSEAIARAALEIMSCGVPLLGTDVGVMPDLLSVDALAPAGDSGALAALLERAVVDSAFRRGLLREQAARMPAFSQEHFLEQSLAVYRSVLVKDR